MGTYRVSGSATIGFEYDVEAESCADAEKKAISQFNEEYTKYWDSMDIDEVECFEESE
jgi:hypothetical protein